jgi:hypothetical protein
LPDAQSAGEENRMETYCRYRQKNVEIGDLPPNPNPICRESLPSTGSCENHHCCYSQAFGVALKIYAIQNKVYTDTVPYELAAALMAKIGARDFTK